MNKVPVNSVQFSFNLCKQIQKLNHGTTLKKFHFNKSTESTDITDTNDCHATEHSK